MYKSDCGPIAERIVKGLGSNWPVLLICTVFVVGIAVACGPAATPVATPVDTPTPEEEKITVAIVLHGEHVRELWDLRLFKEQAEELGIETIQQTCRSDAKVQAGVVENMITMHPDALILWPVDAGAAGTLVDKAHEEGIPVISHNDLILHADVDYFESRDNVFVGELQGQACVDKFPKGNYVIVSGDLGHDVAQDKNKGKHNIIDPLVEKGDITIVSDQFHTGWSAESAVKQVEAALVATDNNIQAVVTDWDGFAIPIIGLLEREGLRPGVDVCVTGEDVELDGARLIAQGKLEMSPWTDLNAMTMAGLQAAIAFARGETPEITHYRDNQFKDVPGKLIGSEPVGPDNLCEFLKRTGWLPIEEVYQDVANWQEVCPPE